MNRQSSGSSTENTSAESTSAENTVQRPDTPSGDFSREVPIEWAGQHPHRIGHYRILEVLGMGGMGTVYLAEQIRPVQRRVAVKLLDKALRGTDAELRFQAEARAMARMNHGGIAHLYGAGLTEEGHNFLVMEFVDGPSITDYCDQHQLPLERRLELFRQACNAVQHAHQKALIHRDLKPGNVLVKEEGNQVTPKIIDFGIAKGLDTPLHESRALTQGLIGTPVYLSPEAILSSDDQQASDASDVRVDVYALGMLLYKLLVGLLPLELDGANMVRAIRRALEEDQPPLDQHFARLPPEKQAQLAALRGLDAATLQRRLHGDLSWIVAKAIQRDRDQRYPSASALGAEIDRYLHHQAVSVAPTSRRYRLSKYVRRHQRSVIAAGLGLLVLVAALTSALIFARQARVQAARAQQEAHAAEEVSRFLTSLFQRADIQSSDTGSLTARELLDKGAARLAKQLRRQPETRARLLEAIATAYINLGQTEQAEALLLEALDLRRELHGEEHPSVAGVLGSLGFLRWRQGRGPEAEQLLLRAREIQETKLGKDHPALGRTLSYLAGYYGSQGDLQQAEALLVRSLAIQQDNLPEDDPDLATSLLRLGSLRGSQGNQQEAEALFRRAAATYTAAYGEEHPRVAAALVGLCVTYDKTERHDLALQACQRALEIQLQQLGPEHFSTTLSQLNLASVYVDLDRLEEAEELYRQVRETRSKLLGADHARTLFAEKLRIDVLARQPARQAEAVGLYETLLDHMHNTLPPEHSTYQQALRAYAELLEALGRGDEATEIERQILQPPPETR